MPRQIAPSLCRSAARWLGSWDPKATRAREAEIARAGSTRLQTPSRPTTQERETLAHVSRWSGTATRRNSARTSTQAHKQARQSAREQNAQKKKRSSPSRVRTGDLEVNSRTLYQLSYRRSMPNIHAHQKQQANNIHKHQKQQANNIHKHQKQQANNTHKHRTHTHTTTHARIATSTPTTTPLPLKRPTTSLERPQLTRQFRRAKCNPPRT